MQALQFLLFIGILLYSAYNVLVYLARRSENKGALRDVQRHGVPIRKLTAEEREAIQPFLLDPAHPRRKPAALLSEEVYELHGEFLQHGLSGKHGAHTLHDTLAGVDVVLPFDAREHLSSANRAEVVLTPRFAVVLKLNDAFDLAGGRARVHAEQGKDRQWQAGAPGAVAEVPPAAGDAAPDPEMGVRLLGQRDETPAEASARAGGSTGLFATLLLAPGAVLLLIAGHAQPPTPWLAGAAALIAAGLAAAWWPRHPAPPVKVNRVQGALAVLTLQNPHNSAIVRTQLFLGDKFPIRFPPLWTKLGKIPADGQVDLDVRVDDYSVVRWGQRFSLDAEVRRFPLVRYTRHVTLAIVGLVLLFVAWLVHGGFQADLAHARSALGHGGVRSYTDPAGLRAAPPAPGDLIRLAGEARGQLAPADGHKPAAVVKDPVRWGGAPLAIAAVEVDPALLRLYDGSAVQAHSDPMLDLMVRMQVAQDSQSAFFGAAPSVQRIEKLTALVRAVEQTCKAGGAEKPCAHLRERLATKLLLADAEEPVSWEKLSRMAQDGTLARGHKDIGITLEDTVLGLRSDLREIAEPLVHARYAGPLQAALDSQRGGVIVHGPAHPGAQTDPAGEEAPPQDDAQPAPDADAEPEATDWPGRWEAYQRLAGPEGLVPFAAEGMVVLSRLDANGDLELGIDPTRTPSNALGAEVRLAAFALGFLLAAVHLTLAAVGMVRAAGRRQALEAHYRRTA